jgi:DNA-binding LacI/PurR family transcriptional regulator
MVTISDVAAHANVGAGTVSRVLNNSPKVSDATRAKVLQAIEVLDYRPNPLAQGLSRGRCRTLGVLVPFFTHASAVERLRGVVSALEGSAYDLVLFNVESLEHRDEHFASITGRDRADGLLVLSLPPPPRELIRLNRAGVPVVLVDARGDDVPRVLVDDVEAGRMATSHLVGLGHRRIAFLGDDPDNGLGFISSTERRVGYDEALAAAGLPLRPELVRHCPHDRDLARAATEELLALPERPTAVFASSDVQAIGVLEAARAAGLTVPGDLSVVGVDDIELSAYVGLTTVRQPLFESGRLGAELLLGLLADEAAGGPPDDGRPDVELVLELVERNTTGPPHPHASVC